MVQWPKFDISIGAAYDTEKEFDSMFATEPYINEYHSNYTYDPGTCLAGIVDNG